MFLTPSKFTRPQTKIIPTALAWHYVANPGTSALANRNYFESLKDLKKIYPTIDMNIYRSMYNVNLDMLIGTKLIYKKPRTTVEGTVTLNPVQLGVTARVGWKRLYGYVNYSFNDVFKRGTGPEGKRLSVGVGLWF